MRYLLLSFLFFGTGCLLDSESNDAAIGGRYDLVAFRDDGSVETKGWVEYSMEKDSSIVGTWQLAGVEGDGRLVGRQTGETLTMDLHPNWADHNFLLQGTAKNGTIEGRWEFVGFAGPMKGGTFVATKQGTH